MRCSDYRIADIASKDTCFNAVASAFGLSSVTMLQVNGIGFNGCAYNNASGVLLYSETPAATPETNTAVVELQYLCDGVATTTTTLTETHTTATTTTTTGLFAMLEGDTRCFDHGVPDITSQDTCFNTAVHYVGLVGISTVEVNNFGFSGCVYNTAANVLLYGVTPSLNSADNVQQPAFRYVCNGIPTTTSTATTATMVTGPLTSTATTTATHTTTTASTTTKVYSKLSGGQRCYNRQITDVLSQEECFGPAAQAAGLDGQPTLELNSLGFSGCIYNTASGTLLFGMDSGVTPATTGVQQTWEYICIGVAKSLFPFPVSVFP